MHFIIFVILALWIGFAILEGKREAIFWHHRVRSSDYDTFKEIDRHPLFALQRYCVLMLTSIGFQFLLDNLWITIYLTVMNMFVFTFFHNGMMYLERRNMSMISSPTNSDNWIYLKGWWDQSTTSTALTTKFMTPISRTIQMILGVCGYIFSFFF